jgi:hypothetical protein
MLLYTKLSNTDLQSYFFSIFDYEDAEYIYNNGDFGTYQENNTKYSGLNYKEEKFREIIQNDPSIFTAYAKEVSTPSTSFYLDVRTIDLEDRIRNNTIGEALDIADYCSFSKPCYVFRFRNSGADVLNLRFFIDGILCTDYFILKNELMDYLYIPINAIKEDSYIEIEQFYSYSSTKIVTFTNETNPVLLEYDKSDIITPTLFDLFITDENSNKIDRSLFKIYCKIDTDNYKQTDLTNLQKISDIVKYDDEYYINIDSVTSLSDEKNVKFMSLSKLRVYALDNSVLNKELHFIVNKVPYVFHEQMTVSGVLPKVKLFDGNLEWKEDQSFVRTFVNGRFIPITYEISRDSTSTYFVLRCYIMENDTVSMDITPYSYEMEYYQKQIPDNFIIDFEEHLSKPFDLKYYDVYLNGRKLTHRNIQLFAYNKIKLFNVESAKNFCVYRKDRDWEYFGNTEFSTPTDDLLNSDTISDADKEKIIEFIISDYRSSDEMTDGTDTEADTIVYNELTDYDYDLYKFYLDKILPEGVIQPNSDYLDKDDIETNYSVAYERYSNKKDRLVIQPNINYESQYVFLVGKSDADRYPSRIVKLQSLIGDETLLPYSEENTIVGSIMDIIYNRLDGIWFTKNPENGSFSASKEVDE